MFHDKAVESILLIENRLRAQGLFAFSLLVEVPTCFTSV
jgi:hypothetical protein